MWCIFMPVYVAADFLHGIFYAGGLQNRIKGFFCKFSKAPFFTIGIAKHNAGSSVVNNRIYERLYLGTDSNYSICTGSGFATADKVLIFCTRLMLE